MIRFSLAVLTGAALAAPASGQDPILGSTVVSWEEIQARPAGSNGMSRPVLRSPTATLDELEIHVTALPAGKTTHPPHTHPNEEVIIIREGTLEAFQNGRTQRLGPGAIIFEASNEPHNVTNVGDTTAVYHVINWSSRGMLRAKPAPSSQEAIKAFYRDWSKATLERGAEGYASCFAEDAILLPPDAPPIAGRAAIREWQERSQKEAAYRSMPEEVREDELEVAGGSAIYRSTLRGQRVPKAGGEGVAFEVKYFDILRQKPDGGWEFTHRMWSSNRPE